MASRIITKKGSGAPLASDLVHGELAVDTVNKRLYTENAGGTVIEVGTAPSTIDINAGTIDGTVIGGSSAAAGSFTTLTTSNNVGIGTSSPQAPLNVSHNSATRLDTLRLTNSNTGGYGPWLNFYGDYSSGYSFAKIGAENESTGATLRFHTADTSKVSQERMRLDNSGNLGIGNSAPSSVLASGSDLVVGNTDTAHGITIVASPTNFSSLHFADAFTTGAASYAGVVHYSHTTDHMGFYTASTERMRIDSSGNVGIGTTSPAAKLEIGGAGEGIILASPDGTRYKITVANGGTLTVTAV